MSSPTLELPRFNVITVATPAAGAELAIKPTTTGHWLIMSIVATLATSAVVPPREVEFTVDDGSNIFMRLGAPSTVAASLTVNFGGFPGSAGGAAAGNFESIDFPTWGIFLQQGFFLRSNTQNLDAGDAYTKIALGVYELPTGPDYLAYPMMPLMVQPTG